MECLRDYIGLRGCSTTAPPSGYYINDLPSISLKMFVSLTDEDSATFLALWNMIQQRSELRFSTDVRAAMASRYKVSSILQGGNIGRVIEGTATAPDGNAFKGFTIELTEAVDFAYIPSPLATIHVQTLSFYCDVADTTEVVECAIWDTNTGEKLFTTNVTLATGWNVIQVNESLIGSNNTGVWNVFCGINATSLSTYTLDVPLNSTVVSCCKARIMGAYTDQTSDIVKDDLTATNSCFGLSGIYTVKCLWDAMVCQNKNLFTRAYWYCLGVELLTEQIYSTNLNSYTTINLQRAKELREEYIVEYNKSLEQTADNMHLACDCCVECSGSVQLVESQSFF